MLIGKFDIMIQTRQATYQFTLKRAETGIYVVLITRDSIPSLPYSVCEIYSIETRDGLHTFEPLYKFNGDL